VAVLRLVYGFGLVRGANSTTVKTATTARAESPKKANRVLT
jgi:hypothetical protein